MIGYNHLGKNGRFGNQMFQYAATRGIAAKHGYDWCIPPGPKDDYGFDDVENLYKKILKDKFNSYAFNRLIDIYLEKSQKDEAMELVDKFMPRFDYHSKSSNKSYVIRINKMKIDSDSFDTRKALSSFCNDIIENENIN